VRLLLEDDAAGVGVAEGPSVGDEVLLGVVLVGVVLVDVVLDDVVLVALVLLLLLDDKILV
jgi:hypothetical protein